MPTSRIGLREESASHHCPNLTHGTICLPNLNTGASASTAYVQAIMVDIAGERKARSIRLSARLIRQAISNMKSLNRRVVKPRLEAVCMSPPPRITSLPTEIIREINTHLASYEIAALTLTCTNFTSIIGTKSWIYMRMNDYARARLLSLLERDLPDVWAESKLRRRIATCLPITMDRLPQYCAAKSFRVW